MLSKFLTLILLLLSVDAINVGSCSISNINNGYHVDYIDNDFNDCGAGPNNVSACLGYLSVIDSKSASVQMDNVKNLTFQFTAGQGEVPSTPSYQTLYGKSVNVNNFGLRITGYFYASQSGGYKFTFSHVDDATALYFGNNEDYDCCGEVTNSVGPSSVLSSLYPSAATNYTVELKKGYYPMKVLYVNYRGNARFQMTVVYPDNSVITSDNLPGDSPSEDSTCVIETTTITSTWTETFGTTYTVTPTESGNVTATVVVDLPPLSTTTITGSTPTTYTTEITTGSVPTTEVVVVTTTPILSTTTSTGSTPTTYTTEITTGSVPTTEVVVVTTTPVLSTTTSTGSTPTTYTTEITTGSVPTTEVVVVTTTPVLSTTTSTGSTPTTYTTEITTGSVPYSEVVVVTTTPLPTTTIPGTSPTTYTTEITTGSVPFSEVVVVTTSGPWKNTTLGTTTSAPLTDPITKTATLTDIITVPCDSCPGGVNMVTSTHVTTMTLPCDKCTKGTNTDIPAITGSSNNDNGESNGNGSGSNESSNEGEGSGSTGEASSSSAGTVSTYEVLEGGASSKAITSIGIILASFFWFV